MTEQHSTSKDSGSTVTSVPCETVPPQNRGRPRSTSISSGSPNPAPGVPLPNLLQTIAPAPPQLSSTTNANPFPWAFPSSSASGSASTSLASNLGPQQWGRNSSSLGTGEGGGHKSSLSVPGIVSPSPLVPGAVPRGGRHRRTQSVSPPAGFPGVSEHAQNGFATSDQAEVRRSSEPSIPVSKPEASAATPVSTSPRQPRLNISTSIGTRLTHQRSPSSPTRSPRAKTLFSTSPTNPSPLDPAAHQPHAHAQPRAPSHLSHHSHHSSAPHHPPISSHAALLQGVRSHALPHSPTLEASLMHHHDVSPLSTSPSMPHQSGFAARRLSGGQHSSSRPFVSTSLSASAFSSPSSSSHSALASPPFGPTSSSTNGRISPVPIDLARLDHARSDDLRHLALDQAMTDTVSDHYSASPPSHRGGFHTRRRSSGSSYSPPLLPLPFDVHSPASPSGAKRSRSGSFGRSPSSATSPASLFLDEDQSESSPTGLRDRSSPRDICRDEVDIARPISPPLPADSLFPTSGPLPAPSPPVSLSSLGFDIPSPIVSSPPRESVASSPPRSLSTITASSSPPFSNLSASRPSAALSPLLAAAPISPTLIDEPPPPASPHHKPISLPPPLNAPTPIPPHLVVGESSVRSRSRSRSREREKERTREKTASRNRSRSASRERDENATGEAERPRSPVATGIGSPAMGLTGLEFIPKVHSPLASPPATEPEHMVQKGAEKTSSATRDENRQSTGEGPEETDEMNASDATETPPPPPPLPPAVPPPSLDAAVSSSLGLPHLSIPVATSPIGTPEHLEESPTSHTSYFLLAPGADLARSPQAMPDCLPNVPSLDEAPNWEDEFDDDEFDDPGHDGTGELGFVSSGRRKSSGTKAQEARMSLLEALGISKTQAEREEELELSERAAERRRNEMQARERERLESLRQEAEERNQRKDDGSLGFMDIDLEAAQDVRPDGPSTENSNSLSEFGEAGDLSVGDLEDPLMIDEASLSALERIFVCAKSEAVEERARVAHHLADWLPAVEICDAVEYVLPLLASLIEDEMVKEVFAPQLDRIMWHFFSHCPLSEFDSGFAKEAIAPEDPVPSRFTSRLEPPTEDSPVPSTGEPSDRSTTPPSTSETSPAQSETSNSTLPRISATTFTAILGALLTDQSTTIAKAAENAIVRFLCRLKNKPLPPVPEDPDAVPSLEFSPAPAPALALSEPDPHATYDFSTEARQVLEDEVVSGIVIGLARLDEEDPERSSTIETTGVSRSRVEEIKQDESSENPVLFTSPEENTFDLEEDDSDLEARILMEWEQEWQRKALENSTLDVPSSSSPQDQIFSSFSPEGQADEESSIGKMVSMSLIGAIAAANCLEVSVLSTQFLPELERMKTETMFYVRKEAVQALGSLAAALPVAQIEETLLPLHSFFSKDQLWLVRRAAVLALPAVCKRLPRPALHRQVVEAIRHFSADDNRNVRSGALEIAGELIYLFHEDPDGVPDELLAFFLGQPLDPTSDNSAAGDSSASSANRISHFQSALESPSSSFLDASNSWQSPGFFAQKPRDADRSILTAFNFPAVILTLGRDKWHLVSKQHQALCKDPVEKARQSLASSLHEVAKIIGPEQADLHLLDPFSKFLQDGENVQTAILENLPTLLISFGPEVSKKALQILGDAWCDIGNWRLREHTLKKLAEFGPHYMQRDGEEEVLTVLAKAFKDSVASVREQAAVAVPPLLNSVLDQPSPRAKLFAFLGVFRTDSSYRNRVAYVGTVGACVRASLPRNCFEQYFLDTLVDLARDKVVSVRIAVSRAIREACQCSALYADPSTRLPLREILSTLTDSPDRDVRLPVLEYYVASPSPSSEPSPLSPLETRQNLASHGVEDSPEVSAHRTDDEDSFMVDQDEEDEGPSDERDDVNMLGEELSSPSLFESDGVLLERPSSSSGDVVTRDDDDFVEVTRS